MPLAERPLANALAGLARRRPGGPIRAGLRARLSVHLLQPGTRSTRHARGLGTRHHLGGRCRDGPHGRLVVRRVPITLRSTPPVPDRIGVADRHPLRGLVRAAGLAHGVPTLRLVHRRLLADAHRVDALQRAVSGARRRGHAELPRAHAHRVVPGFHRQGRIAHRRGDRLELRLPQHRGQSDAAAHRRAVPAVRHRPPPSSWRSSWARRRGKRWT